jgi:hypothetical protein
MTMRRRYAARLIPSAAAVMERAEHQAQARVMRNVEMAMSILCISPRC